MENAPEYSEMADAGLPAPEYSDNAFMLNATIRNGELNGELNDDNGELNGEYFAPNRPAKRRK